MKYSIGIDVGGTSIKLGVISNEGKVLEKYTLPLDPKEKGLSVFKRLSKQINLYKKKYSLLGIGIGMPGILDLESGKLLTSSTTLNNWKNISITNTFKKLTNLDVYMSNDASVAALAEAKFGKYKGIESLILLTLGTGVGGGIIANHELIVGNNGQGGELGHMSIDINGRKCGCGGVGCLETYASATALIKDFKSLLKPSNKYKNIDGKLIFDLYKKNDPIAKKVVTNYVHYLGEGILNYLNIFRPEVVLLSGGIANAGNTLLAPLKKYIEKRNYGIKGVKKVIIDVASLSYDSGLIGAASLLFKNK